MIPLLLPVASALAAAPSFFIVNGQVEPGFPHVVALGLDLDGRPFTVCSGNLITPRVVLSAAHCSGDYPIDLVVEFGVAWFADETGQPVTSVPLETGAIHPDYEPLQSGGPTGTSYGRFDLAVVTLAEDAPVPAGRLYTGALSDEMVGMELFSVGYGLTDGDDGDSGGIKHSVPLVLSDLWDQFLINQADDNPTGGTTCSGDSGGPQLGRVRADLPDDPATWPQVGVHSWGQSGCVGRSAATRVDQGLGWILDQVEAVHGSRDLCEINGVYDDGVCDTWCDAPDPDCEDTPVDPVETAGGCAVAPGVAGGWIGLLPLLAGRVRRRPGRTRRSTLPPPCSPPPPTP
ncbi:MAG: hypothetical protein D6798_02345 [Deltaproteobacteria bacterium]|nr:MAG: hypothetical protein D6798_02345 [Deltaproteobacteria bacterium]